MIEYLNEFNMIYFFFGSKIYEYWFLVSIVRFYSCFALFLLRQTTGNVKAIKSTIIMLIINGIASTPTSW